jgi:lactocepin
MKRALSVLLALVLSLSLVTPTWAAAKTPASGTGNGLTWEKIDNRSTDLRLDKNNAEKVAQDTPEYADTDVVRVSIVLKDASTLAKGYSSEDIATNSAAMKYRQKLESKQEKMAKTISKKALGGEALDVVWNLTLAANIISANVEYGQIEKIEKISGVEAVLIETRYEPCVVKDNETTDPNMATSGSMIGSHVAWADGYTGAGSKVAIIDTGADTDHPSLDPDAFTYAVKDSGATLMTAADLTDTVLEQLNASKKMPGVTADQLYVNAKIPYGFNYVDDDLDITHANDKQGDHGSHVTGIAAGNRYIKNEDGSFSPALDTALTQGVAPDAQVFVMKVFGTNGGAKDSDYMAAIEDAILLGADSVNLSLGSGNPGTSRNSYAAYQAIMENITNSGTVVSISAGNSGNWFENTANGYPYAESNSWTTTGSPGSYTNSLGVASVDNVGGTGDYVEVAGKKLFYTDTTSAPIQALTTLAGEQQFVYVDTAGNAEDFAAVKDILTGKIAICNRGSIAFTDKGNNAISNGAIALIVANNEAGTISMATDGYNYTAPYVSILQADGEYIKASSEKHTTDSGLVYYTGAMTVGASAAVNHASADYYTMSSFSSWGVPGSLEMKPEITAPGGNIYSLKDGGTYQNMSGTSMAAPQITGMAALVAQYIRENDLAEQTGLTVRQLAQSLLMSTAEPMVEDYGEDGDGYYPVLRQGAGLANVANAVTSGTYILMDEGANAGAADGKVKVELGDDPARTGKYSFGFTIHNLEDEAAYFDLSADFFTQSLMSSDGVNFEDTWTDPVASNVKWTVDGEYAAFLNDTLKDCDFNGDGKVDADDGQALLDYVTGVRADIAHKDAADFDNDNGIDTYDAYLFFKELGTAPVVIPAGGSLHVTADVTLLGLDAYDKASGNTGTYVEGYVFANEAATAEGEQGDSHSIPVLGYYGSWTDSSMFDIGSYIAYANGLETRAPYMYAYNGDNSVNNQALTIKAVGETKGYYFGGNPFGLDEFYDAARDAINPEINNFYKMTFTAIRNAAASRLTITDGNGKVLSSSDLGEVSSAFYSSSDATWISTRYTLNMGDTPNTADGTYLNVDLTLAPEYYASYDKDGNATVDWDALSDGATMHYGMVVDKTAPTVSNVNLGTDAKGNKVLTFTAGDDQYMSAVALLDYDKGSVVSKAAGSPEGAAKGASQNFTLPLGDSTATHLLLQVYDYAENYVTYKLNLNPDELAGDVTVKLNTEALTLYKGNVAKLTASVEPFGVQPDTVTWSSDNTDVATVSDNGLVTAVGKGTANITATSVKDPSVSATCVVTVDTIDVTLVGALHDKEGHPILFTWDMENDKTWTKYADLEQDINSATIDFAHDGGSMYQMNTSGLLYEVNPETGATVSASAAATKYGAPMQDMEYAAIAAIQSQKNILVGVDGAYFLYSDPVMANDFSDGWDMSSYLSTYANASEFTAVAWAGYTTNKAGHTVDVFYCLTDSGTIWIMMPDFETGRASMDWVDTDLKLSFPGYDGSLYCSMVLGDDGNLYLSYFTGETNEIYILKYNETTDSYESSLMGNTGNAVWPCSLLAVSDNHAEGGDADNNSLPGTELNVSSSIEAQSQTIEALTPASVTGSLNTANDEGTGAVKPADAETTTPVSSITVSEDEKTVTVTVVPKNDDVTTNGLFTVDYDASVLTLADVTFASQYSSHKDADGKVTLGYVDVDGLQAGTAAATLTFTVSDPTAVDTSTAVTVHQTEINDQTVDVTEDLTADFHQDTKVVNAKPATCTEDGYTGDTVCAACGKVLAKGEVIKALGHDYKDGACTRCGDKQPGVNTGDNSTMTMWTMSAVMALAGAAVLVLRSRKEKYEG